MKTALYRHYAADGQLLYVGISLSAANRLSQHARDSNWFGDIARVEVEHYASRTLAMEVERLAIKNESPLWNRIHNKGQMPPKRILLTDHERKELRDLASHIRDGGMTDDADLLMAIVSR